jgi:hypothetical protein
MTIIDFPDSVAKAVQIDWAMDYNHGSQSNPFTGTTLQTRGLKERWKCTIRFKAMTRAQMQDLQGFFMRVEGGLHTFRLRDPSQCTNLGLTEENPTVNNDAAAYARSVNIVTGSSLNPYLAAGDWITFSTGQMCRVAETVDSTIPGAYRELKFWPHLWLPVAAGTAVTAANTESTYGVFRLTRPPAWTANVANLHRPYTSSIQAEQVILTSAVTPIQPPGDPVNILSEASTNLLGEGSEEILAEHSQIY